MKERNSKYTNELKSNARSFSESQPIYQISTGDNFDIKVFNKIYDENRIDDAYDSGYGEWMQQTASEGAQPKMF